VIGRPTRLESLWPHRHHRRGAASLRKPGSSSLVVRRLRWRGVTSEAAALDDLAEARDPLVIQSALAVVALASGARELGALLAHASSSEIKALLDEWLAWDELYRQGAS